MGRGLYALSNAEVSAHHSLAEAAERHPSAVICLVSALVYHGIGTQMPYETWMMRHDRKAAASGGSSVRFVYCTGAPFSYGVETYTIEGVKVKIYSPSKTVADCFKYRNKIGLDVAIEALREGWRARCFTMDDLWRAAKVCSVERVMQPYLEMLVQ
jgi:predicted transcriptional regulator of viral defense system